MASTTDGCLAEDAASYIGGRSDPIQGVNGDTAEVNRQTTLLIEWAVENKAVLDRSYFEGFVRLEGVTAEHEVFYRESDNRAIKRTHAGCFGVTPQAKGVQRDATPLFYLRRVLLMNRVFDSRIRLEGLAFNKSLLLGKTEGEHPSLVSSQPWYVGLDKLAPHPTGEEIKQFMNSLGFEELLGSYYGWINRDQKISVIDARRDNFIKTKEGVVPIDLVISEHP